MVTEAEKTISAQLATTDDLRRKFSRLKCLIRNCDSRTKRLKNRLISVCKEMKTMKTERIGLLKKVKKAERNERKLETEIGKLKRKFPKKAAGGKSKVSKTAKAVSDTATNPTIPVN